MIAAIYSKYKNDENALFDVRPLLAERGAPQAALPAV
jgi:hypothetical protein